MSFSESAFHVYLMGILLTVHRRILGVLETPHESEQQMTIEKIEILNDEQVYE